MINWCNQCNGWGSILNPLKPWWNFWSRQTCTACGGDGIAKPNGWPDENMANTRPVVSPPPPPSSRNSVCKVGKCKPPGDELVRAVHGLFYNQLLGSNVYTEDGRFVGNVIEITTVEITPLRSQFKIAFSKEFTSGEGQHAHTLGTNQATDG